MFPFLGTSKPNKGALITYILEFVERQLAIPVRIAPLQLVLQVPHFTAGQIETDELESCPQLFQLQETTGVLVSLFNATVSEIFSKCLSSSSVDKPTLLKLALSSLNSSSDRTCIFLSFLPSLDKTTDNKNKRRENRSFLKTEGNSLAFISGDKQNRVRVSHRWLFIR